tara:strand:+ start:1374 stop:1790 length:417 start_codon:yes stop_codon:yes gene_type:complete
MTLRKTENLDYLKISSKTLDSKIGKNKMNNVTSKLGKEYDDNKAFKGYVIPTQKGTTPMPLGARSIPNNAGKYTVKDFLNSGNREGYTKTLQNAGSKYPTIVYTPITSPSNEGLGAKFAEAKRIGKSTYKEMVIQGQG